MTSDRTKQTFDAIDELRELNARHRAFNDERKEVIARMRAAGLDLESIRRAAHVLDSADPLAFDENHNRVRELLEEYSKFDLARKSLRAPARAGAGACAPVCAPACARETQTLPAAKSSQAAGPAASAPDSSPSDAEAAAKKNGAADREGNSDRAAPSSIATPKPAGDDNLDIPGFLRRAPAAQPERASRPSAPVFDRYRANGAGT